MVKQILQAKKKGAGRFVPAFPNGYWRRRHGAPLCPRSPRALHRTQAAFTTARTWRDIPQATANAAIALHVPSQHSGARWFKNVRGARLHPPGPAHRILTLWRRSRIDFGHGRGVYNSGSRAKSLAFRNGKPRMNNPAYLSQNLVAVFCAGPGHPLNNVT